MIPHDTTIAASAIQIVNSALGVIKQTREAAKDIKDSDIKEKLNTILDQFLELKEKIIELKEENTTLREQIQEKQSVKRGDFGYFYKEGEADPACPTCYQTTGKFIYLDPVEENSGYEHRYCRVCTQQFYESSPSEPRDVRLAKKASAPAVARSA